MPCSLQPWEIEFEEKRARKRQEESSNALKAVADRLTHENDQLREAIIGLMDDPNYKIPAALKRKINKDQVSHRKDDLRRLEETFRANKDAERLGLVMLADPKKPLEPQLGFDPDSF